MITAGQRDGVVALDAEELERLARIALAQAGKKKSKYGTPKMKEVEVSKTGTISFTFNQELKIPPFIDNTPTKKVKVKAGDAKKEKKRSLTERSLVDKVPIA